MNLSAGFELDARTPWVARHNQDVREVWDTFRSDKPIRVPVQFAGARTLYHERHGLDWRGYYEDPDEMLRLQLETAKYQRDLPLGDHPLGEAPERWEVRVDFHPVATAASFGCPVLFRPDAVPAHHSLHLSLEECRELPLPDLRTSALLPKHATFIDQFDRRCTTEALRFLGRPVVRVKPTIPSTGGGVFSTALDLRGHEIMSDMYEAPDFVHEFLGRIAEWRIALERLWTLRDGLDYPLDHPGKGEIEITDHGIEMLSVETYETFVGALIDKLARKYGQAPSTFFHHCGRGGHLFPVFKRRCQFTRLHGLTWPVHDVGRVRREVGHDIWITAVIAETIMQRGPTAVYAAVRDFLTPEVKGSGRICLWAPGEAAGIPVASYEALYAAVKEFGRYR
jgi:hypothetical protein